MSNTSKFVLCPCVNRKNKTKDHDLQPFLSKKLPVFWVMGPKGCGKSTMSHMLADSSQYHILSVRTLLADANSKAKWNVKTYNYLGDAGTNRRNVPDAIVFDLLKAAFARTCDTSVGYILDGFPVTLRQAKIFEREICKASMIIYITLVLDALLARKITQVGAFDPNEERVSYILQSKRLDNIAKYYDYKTLRIHSNYPPEDTCTKLVENLEDFWGFKFQRLFNANR